LHITRLPYLRPTLFPNADQAIFLGKSATSVCHQVAAWFPVMVLNFNLVTYHKIAINLTTKAREKISTYLESSES
jgi:hypothetical protein